VYGTIGDSGEKIGPVVVLALPNAYCALVANFQHDEAAGLTDAVVDVGPLVVDYKTVATANRTTALVKSARKGDVMQ